MERYIKTLYIASIIAILAFLGMQAYWLYVRYEYSLREYENSLSSDVSRILESYNQWREQTAVEEGNTYRYTSNYNMDKKVDDNGKRIIAIKVKAIKYDPWRLLGYSSDRALSSVEQSKAAEIALRPNSDADSIVIYADIKDSHPESEIWGAQSAIVRDFNHPFSETDFDSLLRKENIVADISSVITDSVIWNTELQRHQGIIKPKVKITLPYSVLEKKSVVVSCWIPIGSILGGMLWTLIVATMVSLLLIVCLIWQFKIIFRLNRLDKIRNSFITTMIHELKRPVSTLKMCVSGLRNKKMIEDSEIRDELLCDTKEALDQLSAYFSKIRDITFNDRTQIPLSCEKIELRQLVNEMAKRIAVPSGKTIEYENHIDPSVELYADPSHVSNILLNLFENAVKYSGESVTIKIDGKKEENGSVTITVSDNGNGIAQSDLGKVFTRFYRGNATRSDIPGMGLGLAYVKLLVEAHGGTISVESHTEAPDGGTCFTINIPQ